MIQKVYKNITNKQQAEKEKEKTRKNEKRKKKQSNSYLKTFKKHPVQHERVRTFYIAMGSHSVVN